MVSGGVNAAAIRGCCMKSILTAIVEFQRFAMVKPVPGRNGMGIEPAFYSSCRCTCSRLTIPMPLFLCVDEALPDVCVCEECDGGIFLIGSCFYDFSICLVDCWWFGGTPA